MLAAGTLLAGRYELGDRIGSGGMADVHRAHDRVLGRDVAVKIVPSRILDGQRGHDQLAREAVTTACIQHPNVVSVFDAVVEDGATVLVMELLPGRTLADVCRAGPVTVDEALRLADGIAAGLGAAHEVGLVHRDVKPANVLVDEHDVPKIVDFGIARSLDATAATVTVRGSIPYVAPEQVRGGGSDERTDLYALGVVLFELLAGRPPFGGTANEIVAGHLYHPVPDVRAHRDDVPPGVAEVLQHLLAKNPDDRYRTARDVRAALAAARDAGLAETLPVAAGASPTTPLHVRPEDVSLQPGARRRRRGLRRGVVAVAGVAGLLVAAGLSAGLMSGSASADADALSAVPVQRRPAPEPPRTDEVSADGQEDATPIERLRALVVEGRQAGQLSDRAADTLDTRISELARRADGRGKDLDKKVDEFADRVDKLVEDAEVSRSLADRLLAVADEVAMTQRGAA